MSTRDNLLDQLRKRIILGILVGVAVVFTLILVGGASSFASALRDFDWRLLPLVLLLTLFNYLLRYVKWEYYLRVLSIGPIRRRDSLLVFLSGFTMVMTPGKVGELLKSYLLRIRTGVAMSRSAPIIVAERVTDGLALLILAGVGLVVFRDGWQILLGSAVIATLGLILVQHEPTMRWFLHCVGKLRPMRGRAESLEQLYGSTRTLLGPRVFTVGISLGVVSWFGECAAFYLILIGLGLPRSSELLLAATFVFAAAAWIGGISLVPGGIGVAEASVAALLLLVVDDPEMTPSLAATATLLIRFATLWFGLLLGLVALARVFTWTSEDPVRDRTDPPHSEIEGMATAHE